MLCPTRHRSPRSRRAPRRLASPRALTRTLQRWVWDQVDGEARSAARLVDRGQARRNPKSSMMNALNSWPKSVSAIASSALVSPASTRARNIANCASSEACCSNLLALWASSAVSCRTVAIRRNITSSCRRAVGEISAGEVDEISAEHAGAGCVRLSGRMFQLMVAQRED